MNPQGELYRGEKRSPLDVELTESQFTKLEPLTKAERPQLYPQHLGDAKRKQARRPAKGGGAGRARRSHGTPRAFRGEGLSKITV